MNQLSVAYEFGESGEIVCITDSSPVYLGDGPTDFGDIAEKVETQLREETGGTLNCKIIMSAEPQEALKLHNMDKNSDLPVMDYSVTGELLPIEYTVSVEYMDMVLQSVFYLSGVEFELLNDELAPGGRGGTMTIGLRTDNARIITTAFLFQNAE
jgi:CRISPR/Cas system endoribonuclease Cas6 (RAMP superfamily)